ncbi:MAG: hypothetical protein U5K72_02395 [Balneolaceae bacterium]|nr:hypothetical protein [Balneolaceae bacterium]
MKHLQTTTLEANEAVARVACKVTRECSIDDEINTVIKACFFGILNIPDGETAKLQIKEAIQKTHGKKDREIADSKYRAINKIWQSCLRLNCQKRTQGRIPKHRIEA